MKKEGNTKHFVWMLLGLVILLAAAVSAVVFCRSGGGKPEIGAEEAAAERAATFEVLDEFDVENTHFYLTKNWDTEPSEATVNVKDAAAAALEALKTTFPDNKWDKSMRIQLIFLQKGAMFRDVPAENRLMWVVDSIVAQNTLDRMNVSMAYVNPDTGKVIFVYCPREDNTGSAIKSIDYKEVHFSLQDMLYLTSEKTWIVEGISLIREHHLNQTDKWSITYDEQRGMDISNHGYVEMDFHAGEDTDAQRIKLLMDIYTKNLAGYVLYHNF